MAMASYFCTFLHISAHLRAYFYTFASTLRGTLLRGAGWLRCSLWFLGVVGVHHHAFLVAGSAWVSIFVQNMLAISFSMSRCSIHKQTSYPIHPCIHLPSHSNSTQAPNHSSAFPIPVTVSSHPPYQQHTHPPIHQAKPPLHQSSHHIHVAELILSKMRVSNYKS